MTSSSSENSWHYHTAGAPSPDAARSSADAPDVPADWDAVDRLTVPSDLALIEADVVDLGPILGHGAVAARPIPAGTTVAVFGGIAMAGDDFAELDEHRRSISIQVDDDAFLVPVGAPTAATLINHSCVPTCRLSGQITMIAARDIEVGESLTYDYATSDSVPYDEFECLCGERLCRRKVTGNDWMIPELQDRYEGWFSPYLERKIAVLRAERERRDDRDDDALTTPSPR